MQPLRAQPQPANEPNGVEKSLEKKEESSPKSIIAEGAELKLV
ncbi:MAG: hypothetical protein P8016_04970 [Sedimentisphaerales bacterium]